jgi:hypothetical protein
MGNRIYVRRKDKTMTTANCCNLKSKKTAIKIISTVATRRVPGSQGGEGDTFFISLIDVLSNISYVFK